MISQLDRLVPKILQTEKNQGMERDGRSEDEGTGKGSAVRGSWEGLQCRGHPLAREADFSTRGSTFPFLRLIHFHFLYFTILSTIILLLVVVKE